MLIRDEPPITAPVTPPSPPKPAPPSDPGTTLLASLGNLIQGKRDKFGAPASPPANDVASQQAVSQINASSLPAADKDNLRLKVLGYKAGPEQSKDLETVLSQLSGLTPEAQQNLLARAVADTSGTDTQQLAAITSSAGWQRATPAQRAQIAQIANTVDSTKGLPALASLAAQPDRLLSLDTQNKSFLDNLQQMATQPLNPDITGTTTGQLMGDVISEAADPDSISQSCYGTCGPTSLEYWLVKNQPAEYARLLTGLSGPSGLVPMAGGAPMCLQHEYYQSHPAGDSRTASEAMLQNSMMEFARGGIPGVTNEFDASSDMDGITTAQETTLAGQLFNVHYDSMSSDHLMGLARVVTSFGSDSTGDEVFSGIAGADGASQQQPTVVSLELSNGGGHFLDYLGVKDTPSGERVFMRNPWGPGNWMPEGLTVEDASKGIYSVSVEDFKSMCTGVSVPNPTLTNGGDVIGTPEIDPNAKA